MIGAAVLAAPAAAKDKDMSGQLKAVERELKESRDETRRLKETAKSLEVEVGSLQGRMVGAARKVRDLENRAQRLEDELADLEKIEAEKTLALEARRGQTIEVLAALERLARHPPEALIAEPLSSADLVRSAIVLRAAVPALGEKADRLRDELIAVLETRAAVRNTQRALAEQAVVLERERQGLDELVRQKREEAKTAGLESRQAESRLRELAGQAESLRDLMEGLEAQRSREKAENERRARETARAKPREPRPAGLDSAPRGKGFAEALGRLLFPVSGRVSGHYGETDPAGLTRKGILIEARGHSPVLAPYEGKVAYAGKFRGYGQLLIIEHGDGYHSLLAGMERIDSAVEQTLVAGEPVGAMGAPQKGRPALYMEIRRDGHPINPLPWLAARNNKVGG